MKRSRSRSPSPSPKEPKRVKSERKRNEEKGVPTVVAKDTKVAPVRQEAKGLNFYYVSPSAVLAAENDTPGPVETTAEPVKGAEQIDLDSVLAKHGVHRVCKVCPGLLILDRAFMTRFANPPPDDPRDVSLSFLIEEQYRNSIVSANCLPMHGAALLLRCGMEGRSQNRVWSDATEGS